MPKGRKLNTEGRFANVDDAELDRKKKEVHNLNTTKADDKAEAILVKWLKDKGEQMDYWLLGDKDSDKHLA